MKRKIAFILALLILTVPVLARVSSYTFYRAWEVIEAQYGKEIPDSVYQIKEKVLEELKRDKNLTEEKLYAQINRLVAALGDKYSWFIAPDERDFFSKLESGVLAGIGVGVDVDTEGCWEKKYILDPIKGSPAEKAGIKKGDQLVKIDGRDVRRVYFKEILKLVYGEENTRVKITVVRDKREMEFNLSRTGGKVSSSVISYVREDSIAVIKILQFRALTNIEFEKAVENILAQPIKGLILDLRDNPGGFMPVVAEISSFWFRGTVYYEKTRTKNGLKEGRNGFGKTPLGQIKTVILVNQYSASGAETLAGALHDWGIAKLVGMRTHGKGTMQQVLQVQPEVFCYTGDGELEKLQEECRLRLTVGYWLTPQKECVDGKGIEPDFRAEDSEAQMQKAVELLK